MRSEDYDSGDDNGSIDCHILDDSPMSSPKDTVSNPVAVST